MAPADAHPVNVNISGIYEPGEINSSRERRGEEALRPRSERVRSKICIRVGRRGRAELLSVRPGGIRLNLAAAPADHRCLPTGEAVNTPADI